MDVAGTWRLLGVETQWPDGKTDTGWMGDRPTGLLIYDLSGWMSVQMMRDPRPTWAPGHGPFGLEFLLEECVDGVRGYYAYFGTYKVVAAENAIEHQVVGSAWPIEVGVTYTRFVMIDGDLLSLKTPPTPLSDGRVIINRLLWHRMKSSEEMPRSVTASGANGP